jgi:prepilin-type N-terminal cleavage/methylation domain-containing protein
MKRSWAKADKGFTLIELLLVIGMLGVVMMAIYSLYRTQQRSAYVQEDVVEVQQNLRIALDSLTKDIRMAGFLIPTGAALPIRISTNNTGMAGTVDPDSGITASDTLSFNLLSSSTDLAVAYIDLSNASPRDEQIGVGKPFIVDSEETVDRFKDGATEGDWVKIIRPADAGGGAKTAGGKSSDALKQIFQVMNKDKATRSMTLVQIPGSEPSAAATMFRSGDMIVKVPKTVPRGWPDALNPLSYYCNVRYFITDNAGYAACPVGTMCLVRSENDIPAIVATNITNLQFKYLIKDNSIAGSDDSTPTGMSMTSEDRVRSVRVTLTGLTNASVGLSNSAAKMRTLSSVVRIMNKR